MTSTNTDRDRRDADARERRDGAEAAAAEIAAGTSPAAALAFLRAIDAVDSDPASERAYGRGFNAMFREHAARALGRATECA